jgi:hypothetical protein
MKSQFIHSTLKEKLLEKIDSFSYDKFIKIPVEYRSALLGG